MVKIYHIIQRGIQFYRAAVKGVKRTGKAGNIAGYYNFCTGAVSGLNHAVAGNSLTVIIDARSGTNHGSVIDNGCRIGESRLSAFHGNAAGDFQSSGKRAGVAADKHRAVGFYCAFAGNRRLA